MPTTSPPPPSKYRGATILDLDLPPALSTYPTTRISSAMALAYDRDYSQLTVISATTKKLLGYVTMAQLQAGDPNGPVSSVMTRFDRRRSKGYTVITPDTGLDELERFFEGEEFAVVTDADRRWVLGVATRGDLDEWAKRRVLV
ncbi:hypothetical protein EX30DRAFT_360949 [Ascodesmis nigricans]|uniref:Uncharacterized protein n=1 Tax=Ascodesmis nigricans TaxID=341454 RepID=A0A4V3SJR8_9PEZI|nr:hypothetical protein EX30DRAFT_360949 [Ascodesmis nigricans]